jgi:hypothetical protein
MQSKTLNIHPLHRVLRIPSIIVGGRGDFKHARSAQAGKTSSSRLGANGLDPGWPGAGSGKTILHFTPCLLSAGRGCYTDHEHAKSAP